MNKLMGKTFRLATLSFLRSFDRHPISSIRHSPSHKHFGFDQPSSFISNLVMEEISRCFSSCLHRNWKLTLNCVSTSEFDIWSPRKTFPRPPKRLEASFQLFSAFELFFSSCRGLFHAITLLALALSESDIFFREPDSHWMERTTPTEIIN